MTSTRAMRRWFAVLLLAFMTAGSPASGAETLDSAVELMKREEFVAAAAILKRLAEQGNIQAQAYYGGLLLAGAGVQRDPQAARVWLEKAAPQDAQAAFNLGMMSELGDGVPADPSVAARWYEMSALQGFPSGMTKAGGAHREGWGVPRNLPEAARWFRLAAEAGEADGQNLLGAMIAMGEAPGSRAEAYAWFVLADRAGQPDAAQNLTLIRPLLSAEELADGDRRVAEWRAPQR